MLKCEKWKDLMPCNWRINNSFEIHENFKIIKSLSLMSRDQQFCFSKIFTTKSKILGFWAKKAKNGNFEQKKHNLRKNLYQKSKKEQNFSILKE